MGGIMGYIAFLKSNAIVRRLTFIQLLTYFAAWFSNVAIYTLLIRLDASALVIALVSVGYLLPAVVQAPFTGPLIDILPLKKLMTTLLVLEIVSTILLVTIDSLDEIWLLLVLVFVRMGAASFYFTAEMSLLPRILGGQELKIANEIHSIIWSLTYTAGMAASGLAVDLFGISWAIIFDAALFLVALALFLPLPIAPVAAKSSQKFLKMIQEGLFYLGGRPKIIHLMLLHATVGITAYDTLVALLADHFYKEVIAVPLAIGFINATRALALMAGPAFLGKIINETRLLWFFLLQGFGVILWGSLQENFYLSLIGVFAAGFWTSTIWSYTYTMLQQNTNQAFLGRVLAYNDMLFMLAGILTSLFIGAAAQAGVKLTLITYGLGGAFFAVALYYGWFRKKEWNL